MFSDVEPTEGFCDDWGLPEMYGDEGKRLPAGRERWCTVRHASGGTAFPKGLAVITRRNGCSECEYTVDVRFADGSVSLNTM